MWNVQAVDTHFLPMDGELIRSIPLSGRRQANFWAWHYEKSGVFTVRSAYRMLASMCERRSDWIEHNPGRSDVEADQREWADLWSIKVPSKIRVFLWRLAKHSDGRCEAPPPHGTNECVLHLWRSGLMEAFTARVQHGEMCLGSTE